MSVHMFKMVYLEDWRRGKKKGKEMLFTAPGTRLVVCKKAVSVSV